MWRFLGVLLMATFTLADRTYVQNLLDSDLSGDDLYAVYDKHYDGLSKEDKAKEKSKYPKEVYKELLEHRKEVYKELLERRKRGVKMQPIVPKRESPPMAEENPDSP